MIYLNNRFHFFLKIALFFIFLLFYCPSYAKPESIIINNFETINSNDGIKSFKYKIENPKKNKRIYLKKIDGFSSPVEFDNDIKKDDCRNYKSLLGGEFCYINLNTKQDADSENIMQKLSIAYSYYDKDDEKQKCKHCKENPIIIIALKGPKITKLINDKQEENANNDSFIKYKIENLNLKKVNLKISSSLMRNNNISDNCNDYLPLGNNSKNYCYISLNTKLDDSLKKNILYKLHIDWSYDENMKLLIEELLIIGFFDFKLNKSEANVNTVNIIGTTNLGDQKELNYSLTNIGTIAASEININGYLEPIIRDNNVYKNCASTLAPGDTCNIKLLVNSRRAGKINQTLKITTKNSTYSKKQEQNIPIEIDVEYLPFLLIKKNDIPLNTISATKNFNFTMPITIHTIDENVDANAIFVGTDIGLLRQQKNSAGDTNWEFTDHNLPNNYPYVEDMHIMGDCIHAIFVNKKNTTEEKSYISNSCDSGLTWDIPQIFKKIHGIRNVQEKLLVTSSETIIYFFESQSNFNLFNSFNYANFYDYKKNKITNNVSTNFLTFKMHGEENNICVATNEGIFITNEFDGKDAKHWRKYNELTPGFASDLVNVVHCDQSNFYAGTNKGLSISEDNGNSWRTTLNKYGIYGIYAKNNKVWVATKNELFYSEDNGLTWVSQALSLGDYAMLFFAIPLKSIDQYQDTLTLYKKSNKEYIDFVLKKKCGFRAKLGLFKYGAIDCETMENAYFKLIKKCVANYNEDKKEANDAKDAFEILNSIKAALDLRLCSKELQTKKELQAKKNKANFDRLKKEAIQTNDLLKTPQILSINPADESSNITPDECITVSFDRSMDQKTLNINTMIVVKNADGTRVPGHMVGDLSDSAVFVPESGSMAAFTKYTVILFKEIMDINGVSLSTKFSWDFTTGA